MKVEVVYPLSNKSVISVWVVLPSNAVVADAVCESGLLVRYPEISTLSTGIFSQQVHDSTILQEGDRVEIYRSLFMDPLAQRRQKAKSKAKLHAQKKHNRSLYM